MPAPSIDPDQPFAAVSSSGVRARLGTIDPCVGRVIVSTVAAHVAAAMTTTRRRVERHPDPGRAVRHELRDVAEEQHAAAWEPVGQVREERRQQRTRNELDDGDDPDTCRPDRGVGIQQDRDPRAELDRVEQEEGQLEAAEGRVVQDRPDDAPRRPEGREACAHG